MIWIFIIIIKFPKTTKKRNFDRAEGRKQYRYQRHSGNGDGLYYLHVIKVEVNLTKFIQYSMLNNCKGSIFSYLISPGWYSSLGNVKLTAREEPNQFIYKFFQIEWVSNTLTKSTCFLLYTLFKYSRVVMF